MPTQGMRHGQGVHHAKTKCGENNGSGKTRTPWKTKQ